MRITGQYKSGVVTMNLRVPLNIIGMFVGLLVILCVKTIWFPIQNFRISHVNGKYPRSESWCENNIFWSEIGSGLANRTAHPHQEFSRFPSPPRFLWTFHLRELRGKFCQKEFSTDRNALARCIELINRLEKLVFISKKVATDSYFLTRDEEFDLLDMCLTWLSVFISIYS